MQHLLTSLKTSLKQRLCVILLLNKINKELGNPYPTQMEIYLRIFNLIARSAFEWTQIFFLSFIKLHFMVIRTLIRIALVLSFGNLWGTFSKTCLPKSKLQWLQLSCSPFSKWKSHSHKLKNLTLTAQITHWQFSFYPCWVLGFVEFLNTFWSVSWVHWKHQAN